MNIFVLDTNPEVCAQYHCNQHVIKMCLETAQVLCAVRHINKEILQYEDNDIPYRPTHKKHPVVLWAAERPSNYFWLIQLGQELCKEYTFRYGKRHKSQDVIENCLDAYLTKLEFPTLMKDIIPDDFHKITNRLEGLLLLMSPFAQCMPECYRIEGNPVAAYRNYYNGDKARFAQWKKREVPYWFYRNIEK